jgi:hypothetical protein
MAANPGSARLDQPLAFEESGDFRNRTVHLAAERATSDSRDHVALPVGVDAAIGSERSGDVLVAEILAPRFQVPSGTRLAPDVPACGGTNGARNRVGRRPETACGKSRVLGRRRSNGRGRRPKGVKAPPASIPMRVRGNSGSVGPNRCSRRNSSTQAVTIATSSSPTGKKIGDDRLGEFR